MDIVSWHSGESTKFQSVLACFLTLGHSWFSWRSPLPLIISCRGRVAVGPAKQVVNALVDALRQLKIVEGVRQGEDIPQNTPRD
jgi:hypothetical protein